MSLDNLETREPDREVHVRVSADVPPGSVSTAAGLLLAAADRISAALAIHHPCHTTETEPWGCEHGHYDDECTTGIPSRPAVCVECTDGNDDHLTYPCPTARALGAEGPR